MESKNSMSMLITAFIFLIVGVVLVSVLADQISLTRDLHDQTNESLDIETARCGGADDNEMFNELLNLTLENTAISISEMRLANQSVLVEDTDWRKSLWANGTIRGVNLLNTTTYLNSSVLLNTTYVDYKFEPDEYVSDSTSRTLLGLIIIFFVIAIVLYVIHGLGIFDIGRVFR